VLDRLDDSFNESFCNMYQLESMLLRAWAFAQKGEEQTGQETLLKALQNSHSANSIFSYLQFGERMKGWLEQMADGQLPSRQGDEKTPDRIDTVLYLNKLNAGFSLVSREDETLAKSNGHKVMSVELTRREEEVLQLLAKGLSYMEIAERLTVSENTVRTHIRGLYGKLDVNNRVLAITRANEMGLIE
jgi:ATP/maltotriose-dependent transcriptional regulator MalT